MKTKTPSKKVAIIGIGCRFAGGIKGPENFWLQLKNCTDGVKTVPADRWNIDLFYDPDEDAPGKAYVKNGAFLEEDVYDFDYNFFNISRREALSLDPQQRLLLMTTYEALDDAGQNLHLLRKTPVGVFIGGFMLDNYSLRTGKEALKHINSHTVSVDTACSSSMVAIHLACQSILNGETMLAVAGGVNVMLDPATTILMCKGKFLARDGRSKAFFEQADGYGRGEGAGVIVLKALDRAIADNDAIYAVIESTAVNQDGKTDGISLPSKESQITVIGNALQAAGIHPSLIDYVEAHGTGTKAGDPIELGALGAVYGKQRSRELPVGSVKINIGHTEAAAGVAGVIKTALMLKHGGITPHMNLGKLSPDIPFRDLNIRIPLQGETWYFDTPLKYAAVNSFGYGGTNGHAILSAYTAPVRAAARRSQPQQAYRFLVSGKSARSLRMNAEKLLAWLEQHPDAPLPDLAFTLSHRRSRHACNWLITAGSHTALANGIREKLAATEHTSRTTADSNGKLVWVFTGMGPQWYGMGQQLYKTNGVFRAALDKCDALYQGHAGYSLLAEMQQDESSSRITRNYLAQAANFFIQIGISEMLNSYGVPKDAIIGHSVGEIAAAVVAGAITLEDGVQIIYHRGRLLEEVAGQGTLLSIGLGAADAADYIRRFPGVEIAAINSPASVAVAGSREILDQLAQQLNEEGIFAKAVRVEVAYHSSQMNVLKEKLITAFSFVQPRLPHVRLYSTVNSCQVDSIIHTAEYWWRNVRETVRFHATLETLMQEQYANFIEIGPHPVLGGVIREIASANERNVNTFFTLKRQTDEDHTINRNLEECIDAGIPVTLNPTLKGNTLRLPAYAWDKEYCWAMGSEVEAFRMGANQSNVFLDEQVAGPVACWKTHLNKPALAWLKDHQVGNTIIFPGAGYIENMLAVLSTTTNEQQTLVLEQVAIDNPLSLQPGEFPELYAHLSAGTCTISSLLQDSWTTHARGTAWATHKYQPLPPVAVRSMLAAADEDSRAEAYRYLASLGLHYQHCFQTISAYAVNGNKVYARLDSRWQPGGSVILNPTLLDGAFQSLLLLMARIAPAQAYLPVGIQSLKVFKPLPSRVYAVGEISGANDSTIRANLQLVDETGEVLADLKGLACKKAAIADSTNSVQQWIYKYTFRSFEPEKNGALADAPIIATGDRTRFQQLAPAFGEATAFIPADALAAAAPEHFQLVYLPPADEHMNITVILESCHRLIRLLQELPAQHAPQRFVLLLDHGLTDQNKPACEKVNVHHASLAGFGRSVMTEIPDWQVKIVDIQRTPHPRELQEVLQHAFPEDELVLTNAGWQYGVLVREDISFPQRTQAPVMKSHAAESRLEMLQKGGIGSLQFRDFTLDDPGPHEVQVAIAASSVNFKDVMKAMGMLNEAALENTYAGSEFGLEGAGVVRKVHHTVKDIRPGDRVYFLKNGLRTAINVHEDLVFKLPDHISFQEAATFLVYLTAWISLIELGQLRKGQRVLIHSAAGGVGMAACRIAQATGAEIFATVGTDAKKALLEKAGIRHIYNSRSLNFCDEILKDTNGEGVDIVLNSLAGPALFKSLELVRTLGAFIELGKQDITSNQSLALMPFNKGIRFISFDLDKAAVMAPGQMRAYFQNFITAYAAGALQPLLYEVYDLSRFREGFEQLATGRHAGKVVIDLTDKNIPTVPEVQAGLQFADNECVLVTGGCSGFGLRTALWLAERGARHLVLGSRSGAIPPAEAAIRQQFAALGCNIYEIALDITDKDAVRNAVQYPAAHGLRLAGVIHAAAVLEDSIISNLTPASFNRVYLPKAQGALHLHELTKDIDLRFFVCYASTIGYLGNPGQVAYAAANYLLTGLVDERRRLGLPATSIGWGSIDEVGMLSRNEQARAHLSNTGLTPIPPATGLNLLEQALNHYQNHIMILDIDWDRWAGAVPGTWAKLRELLKAGKNNGQPAFISTLKAHAIDEWEQIIITEVSQVFADITGNAVTAFQPGTRLADFGLDSLMSVELSIVLRSKLGLDIPMMEILGAGTFARLAQLLKDKILRQQSGAATNRPVKQTPAPQEKNLVSEFLKRICIERPYFSLAEVEKTPEGANATVPGFYWNRNTAFNLSDSTRHMALLGSFAVADLNPDAGRHYYPAEYGTITLLKTPAPNEALTLYAKPLAFDHTRSRGEAYTAIKDSKGETVAEMQIRYHVIPEEVLYRLFEPHINTDPSWQDVSSGVYEEDTPVHAEIIDNHRLRFVLDKLAPEQCVGHFSNLPAFPASVMTRYAFHLIEAARAHFYKGLAFEIEKFTCETHHFVFAGESVCFTVYEGHERKDDTFHWICEIESAGKPIARLETYEKATNGIYPSVATVTAMPAGV